MKNQKGVSLISLIITIIVVILITTITLIASDKPVDEAIKVKFQNDLKEVVNALEIYHQKAHMYGVEEYDRDNLEWDGASERGVNTAKIEDENHVEEDKIKYIFTDSIPETLKGKMTIEGGEIKISESYKTEYDWAVEMYPEMEE